MPEREAASTNPGVCHGRELPLKHEEQMTPVCPGDTQVLNEIRLSTVNVL